MKLYHYQVNKINIYKIANNFFLISDGTVVVRPEEALIVLFVLVLWIGAIGLFFHRYANGKKNHDENVHQFFFKFVYSVRDF